MTLALKKTHIQTNEHLEHQRLTTLVNSMADAVIAVDQKVRVVLYNGAALNIFDVNTIKHLSRLHSLFTPLDNDNQPIDMTQMVLETHKPTTNRDLSLRYSDGSKINLFLSIAPVHLGYGEEGQQGFVLVLRDITREKSLEEERDEFISVVSHELRTPIAIAEGNIGNAQYVSEHTGDLKVIRKALAEAHSQVLYLSDMINDLSTLSRAERGVLEVSIDPINVHDLLQELADNYQSQAAAKHLKLTLELDPKLELLHSSKLYIREILQNFITNALKYTAKGHVTLHAQAQTRGVKFRIEDTGIGINKSDQDRVYDKFFRSEDFRTREANGTGLGLYVAMKLARLIHADISLKSELNKGSTFTIFVPNLR